MTNYTGPKGIDWDSAFAYWAGIPRTARTWAAVAEKFGVSETAVRNASKREGWLERVSEIDRKAAARVQQKVTRAHEVRTAEALEIIDLLQQQLRDRVKRGDVVIDITEYVQLAKFAQLLVGEPTSRIEVAEVQRVFLAVYRTAAAFVPRERRAEFLVAVDAATAEVFVELESERGELLGLPRADDETPTS